MRLHQAQQVGIEAALEQEVVVGWGVAPNQGAQGDGAHVVTKGQHRGGRRAHPCTNVARVGQGGGHGDKAGAGHGELEGGDAG